MLHVNCNAIASVLSVCMDVTLEMGSCVRFFFSSLSLLMNTTFDRFGTRHTIKGREPNLYPRRIRIFS